MGNKYKKRLFSYWQDDTQQVWILNSIGKYKPITAAFSIQNCSVKSAHVIVYREQHGYEIKYPFFFWKKVTKFLRKLLWPSSQFLILLLQFVFVYSFNVK